MRSDPVRLLSALLLAALACKGASPGRSTDPFPSGVEPPAGYSVRQATVLIRGSGFLAKTTQSAEGGAPALDTRHRAWLGDVELEGVTWLDERTLRATVPAGMAEGTYALLVENALGKRGSLEGAYAVVASTPPELSSELRLSSLVVTEGQSLEAVLTVTNTGGTKALQVTSVLVPSGTGALAPAAEPAPQDLEPGATGTFSWTLTARAAGDLTLTASGAGRDPVTGAPAAIPSAVAGPVRVAAVGVLALAASPSSARATVGQTLTLSVELRNGSTTDVNGVAATVALAGQGALTPVSAPAAVDLAPGGSRVVSFVYTAQAAGEVTFDVGASGVEAGTGRPLTAAHGSASVTVQTPPALSSEVAAAPVRVSAGQRVTLTATVTNSGGATATGVRPTIASAPAGMALVAPPDAQDVAGGASATFVLQLSTSVAASGTVILNASGTDANTGASVAAPAAASPALVIQAPAMLAATVSAAPTVLSAGQPFTLTLALQNGGTASATVSGIALDAAAAALCANQTPASPQTVAGGGSRTFTWSCAASTPGTVSLDATVTWADENVGAPRTTRPAAAAAVTIQAPAALAASVVAPAVVSAGQGITLTLTVTNGGVASAGGVTPRAPAITSSDGATATLATGPTPTSVAVLAGGQSATFTWTFVPALPAGQASGHLSFSAGASALDANSQAPLSVTAGTPAAVVVQRGAAFVAAVGASRTTASVGQTFTLSLTVTNNGAAVALGVTPTAPVVRPAGGATCGPASPASPQNVGGGASTAFTWTCTALSAGNVELTSTASGTDVNSGAALLAAPSAPATVAIQDRAALSASVAANRAVVSVAQPFDLTLTLSNDGGAPADVSAVAPSVPAGVGCSGPTPAVPQVVTRGQPLALTWSCAAAAPGTHSLNATVTWADANVGVSEPPLTPATPASVVVQGPAVLGATFDPAPPGTRNVGQPFSLTLRVTNSGGATAVAVTPAAIAACPATPAARDIAAGAYADFVYAGCASTSPGPLALSATASGTDANSAASVTSSAASAAVVIQTAADLTATFVALPASVNVGQSFSLTLRVTNSGGATAVAVNPADIAACPTTPPAQDVAGGTSIDFGYANCSSAFAGTLALSATAAGTDGNALTAVTSSAATGSIAVQSGAGLTAAFVAPPASVNVGQTFSLTLRVTNAAGGAGANAVTPQAIPGCSPTPGPRAIPAGTSYEFVYPSCSSGTAGTLDLTVTAAGTDANTGGPVTSSPATTTLAVQTPARLSGAIAAAPAQVSTGQTFTVSLTVTNGGVGNATANGVSPGAPGVTSANGAAATLLTGPDPATPQTILGGGSQVFTWTYQATSAGTLNLSGAATGTDANNPTASLSTTTSTQNAVTVLSAASLTASIAASRSVASTGQPFSVTLTLAKDGTAAANLSGLVTSFSPAASCTGPTPALPASIASGSVDLVWTCSSATAGPLSFEAAIAWADANNPSVQLGATTLPGASVTVEDAATLSASISASPTAISTGQPFAVTLTLTKGGAATATLSGLAPSFSAEASCTGPSPALPTSIASGSVELVWSCASTTAGPLSFDATVTWADANAGPRPPLTPASPAAVTVQSAAGLVASVAFTGPTTVSTGQPVPVTLTVTNTGSATANVSGVAPSPAARCTPAVPTAPATLPGPIAGGATASFTWSCTPTDAEIGTMTLNATVTGTDANDPSRQLGATASPGASVTVEAAAALSATLQVPPPASVNEAQQFSLTVRVANTGGAGANAVATTSLAGTCSTNPAPQDVAAGGHADFVYAGCALATAGTLRLSLGATGTDENSAAEVRASSLDATVAVQTPASLAGAISVTPSPVPASTPFVVTLVITNSGQAGVVAVTPTGFSVSRADLATCTLRDPSASDIPGTAGPGGNTHDFTWDCTNAGAGDVQFTSGAQGHDANEPGATRDAAPVSTTATLEAAGASAGLAATGAEAEAVLVATDPFADAVPFAFVTGFQGFAWVGPSRDGRTLLRFDPAAGSAPVTAGLAIPAHTGESPASNLAWTGRVADTLGASGCTAGTTACGPDGEDGPSLLFSGSTGTGESLAMAGARYAYAASSADAPLELGWADLGAPAAGGAASRPAAGMTLPAPSGATGRLVLGWTAPGPGLAVVRAPVPGTGLDAAADGGLVDLEAWAMPGVGLDAAGGGGITALALFGGRLHAAGPGGLVRATVAEPAAYSVRPLDWAPATPSADAWASRSSAAPSGTARPLPGDRAVPRLAAFGSCGAGPCLLAVRNVQGTSPAVVAQLWRCDPSTSGDPQQCEPADWSLAAPNESGDLLATQLGEPTNEGAAVLVATSRWLYLGFDNRTKGVQLYRTSVVPARLADFVGRGGCTVGTAGCEGVGGSGLGDPAATRILDAAAVSAGGRDALWLAVGDGAGPVRIFRIPD